jgi:hypothetical protein
MSWSPHGMLIMAAGREGKPLDYDELARWTRVEVQARHEMAQEQDAEGVYGIPSEEAGIGPRAIQVTQSKGAEAEIRPAHSQLQSLGGQEASWPYTLSKGEA